MKIRIGDQPWRSVVMLDPPSKTVTLDDGSVWHLAHIREEILELDVFMSRLVERYAPWEVNDCHHLVLSGDQRDFPSYEILSEDEDRKRFEMYYFYKFLGEAVDFLEFPDSLRQGVCVQVRSAAVRYFLADTLFFDYLLSGDSKQENIQEINENMTRMRRRWLAFKAESEGET